MKKLLTITAGILMIMGLQVHAQTPGRSNAAYISLGPIGGVGHSWVSAMSHQDFKPSVHLGIGMVYSRHEHWGWGADFTVSHEGYRIDDEPANSELTVNPVYLRLTPKVYYFFGKYGNSIRPKIYAGPSLAFKADERVSYNGERLSDEEVMFMLHEDEVFDDVDFGLTGGAGLNIRLLGNTWLNLDGSYYHGLADATGHDNSNRNLRLNVGVLFGL